MKAAGFPISLWCNDDDSNCRDCSSGLALPLSFLGANALSIGKLIWNLPMIVV